MAGEIQRQLSQPPFCSTSLEVAVPSLQEAQVSFSQNLNLDVFGSSVHTGLKEVVKIEACLVRI